MANDYDDYGGPDRRREDRSLNEMSRNLGEITGILRTMNENLKTHVANDKEQFAALTKDVQELKTQSRVDEGKLSSGKTLLRWLGVIILGLFGGHFSAKVEKIFTSLLGG